jgi:hypothetical protein
MLASRKVIGAFDRGRKSGAARRRGRLIRLPARIGALIAISIFCPNRAAARFDRFACTATPYG